MGKSAQVLLEDVATGDFGAQADEAGSKAKKNSAQTHVKTASDDGSEVCTMDATDIRQRLDAFAKELARAQRERSQH